MWSQTLKELKELMNKIKHEVEYETAKLGVQAAKEEFKKYEELRQEYDRTVHKRKLVTRNLRKIEKER